MGGINLIHHTYTYTNKIVHLKERVCALFIKHKIVLYEHTGLYTVYRYIVLRPPKTVFYASIPILLIIISLSVI